MFSRKRLTEMSKKSTCTAQSRRTFALAKTYSRAVRVALLASMLLSLSITDSRANAVRGPMPLPSFATAVLAQTNIQPSPSSTAPAAQTDASSPSAPTQQQQPSQVPFLIMMVAIFAFFYLFIIRPQNKQQKEHERLVKELKKGDQIITQGGLFGRISDFDESNNAIIIEISKGVRIKMLRTQVARLQGTEPATNDKKAAKGRS